jgi:hypothetical protein
MRTRFRNQREEIVMSTADQKAIRELDRRMNDGFDVRLLWNSRTNRVFVAVEDHRGGGSLELDVDASDALEAFHHPFAYAANDYDPGPIPVERCSRAAGDEEER